MSIFRSRRALRQSPSWLVISVVFLACAILVNMVVLLMIEPTENHSIFQRRINLERQGVVHLVTTRFMQHQPSLLALGHARLELFKKICLPTMLYQEDTDFIWLILIDPDLHTELLEAMKELIAPYRGVFLIRCDTSHLDIQTVNQSMIESGDLSLLEQVASTMSSKIVVETRLDADDGLARPMMKILKERAFQQLSFVSKNPNGWVAYCIHRHFEWHGQLSNALSPAGNLILVSKKHCVTPGLTFALAPGADRTLLPARNHQWLQNDTVPCTTDHSTGCLHRFDEIPGPVAVRARTVTSAGMTDVGREYSGNKSNFEVFWENMEEHFSISKQSLEDMQSYLTRHAVEIARDNLEGQCTQGHSCKEVSKARLRKLLNESEIVQS